MSEICAAGVDIGTMFLQSARDDGAGNVVYNTVRDCYREISYDQEFEDTLKSQCAHYLRDDKAIYVLGDDAYLQAGMAEFGAELGHKSIEILKRPMRDGILNPDSPKMAMMILRELVRACVEKEIGPARKGEILYFSIPANPVDSEINNAFHRNMAEQYLRSLGFDARPLGEGLAIIYSENPKMYAPDQTIPFTGVAISMGAGQTNFCLAERGLPIDEFSVARAGDYIDSNAARMTGQPRTKVTRIKERKLDFRKIDRDDEIILALECYYDELINYIFSIFARRFSGNKGSIEHPIEIILSGGTASPPGLDLRVNKILDRMNLPFEVKQVRKAKDMLRSVATGCYLRAKQAAKKMAATSEAMKEMEPKDDK